MRHSTYEPDCHVCRTNAGESQIEGGVLWSDERWLVRHAPPPYGVAGWMTLHTIRHVGGPAHFSDGEAGSFGPVLRWLERTLERTTESLRIYTAAMGESAAHFHAHLVPRYPVTPGDVKAWGIFDLSRRAKLGEITVEAAEVQRITRLYRGALNESTWASTPI